MASSSSSSSLPRWEYDVFLSFRGEDTRKTFVGHLYTALNQRGIRTFKDDERLEQGKSISLDLVKSINESSVAVIVFSKNYANSAWCLDELVEILECRRTKGQIVLPIFYDVKASEVRKQKRSYEEAFREHEEYHKEEMGKVQRWRAALKEAANLSGFDLEDAANGYEEKFIQKIVQAISRKLQPIPFKVAEYEVGIDSRAKKVIMLLNDRPKDKLFVGICGTGGVGKTTVVKAVFNQISNEFERSCFLENVREESTKQDGLAKLQQKLLRETLMDNYLKISNSDRGINEIKLRLQHQKVLIVLDDVDKEKQLMGLAGIGHDFFGSGSRIIITTRDERLLMKYNVKTYHAELLDDKEALELFSWHAFKRNNPVEEFRELSHRVKDYSKGLPLALRVLGSFLCERSISEWVSELDKLKSNPPEEIQDVLRISYDGLDKKEKAIFLDIACFFKGYDAKFAMDIFESCGFHPVIGINVLTERSLITISEYNTLWMHDLIQEMGREIVRQESEDPGKRSRLWSYEDIDEVTENTVTENIEAIMLTNEGLDVSTDAFTKMRKLRILEINGVQLHGCLTYLSNELRYLDWNGYPEEYLPNNFHPKKLVRLHLRNSLIKEIRMTTKFLKMLKVLDLSYCKNLPEKNLNFSEFPILEELYLIGCESLLEVEFDNMKVMDKLKLIDLSYCENLKRTPNLSLLPCLEKLKLHYCKSLVEVHPSIEFHERLVSLDFYHCENLKSLATRMNVKSLNLLCLHSCYKLETFPEIQGEMECLTQLQLIGTAIKELPPSVVEHLKGLKDIFLTNCKTIERLPINIGVMKNLRLLSLEGSGIKDLPPSIEHLKSLENLDLGDCKMVGSLPSNIGEMKSLEFLKLGRTGIKELPPSIVQLTNLKHLLWFDCGLDEESILNLPHSLQRLDLSSNNFASLPASFAQLTQLESLDLDDCLSLQTLESLPSSIREVNAERCVSLEWYSVPKSEGGRRDYREFIFTDSHKLFGNHENKKLNIYSESVLQEIGETFIVLPGSEIPNWFSHICESDEDYSVCFRVDPNSCNNLKGIVVCAVIGFDHEPSDNEDDDDDVETKFAAYVGFNLNFIENPIEFPFPAMGRIRSDHIMLTNLHDSHAGIKKGICNSDGNIEVSIVQPVAIRFKAKKWGIHLVMDEHTYIDEDA
ncbi:disease resistance protein RUN1-like [Cornus florida]|uniref:disease resistance protein RUN1-like n=1 Tax=Cornus florida TaxID=4283 RepID=UPI0028A02846|nr:disease resistance protein RUN1-like [Cornus florida]XP_059660258.1 disease resistance protein RUN1-like [Cornus florida]XP_059660259.1 disease resistance protein RUN1-like [Cornus florida]XP_059660260.1 disease resistance protein RUN1-like [Cornus florida]XP_059660261.1 disease resistance protein RUN1-like [Cornus florida]XP_059660262.1 disease resistance protein RUN1-like [Cornus florida]XP_059660263.1 disease resistance protein RUN1-like [Cornus florida]XP_059660265.1 disease resistanc